MAILTINTNGFGSTDQQTQTVTKGTFVATTATPNAGYKFDHWQTSWATNIPDNPLALIVSADQTITAIFIQAVNTTTPTS